MLCPLFRANVLLAQLFTTSAHNYHSYGGGSSMPIGATEVTSVSMRSTSAYTPASTSVGAYSTAPIQMANGTIKTVASSLDGSSLADESGFIPTDPQRSNGSIAPPREDPVPLGMGWDSILFLSMLLTLVALRRSSAYKQVAS